jgi:hypothetical protein
MLLVVNTRESELSVDRFGVQVALPSFFPYTPPLTITVGERQHVFTADGTSEGESTTSSCLTTNASSSASGPISTDPNVPTLILCAERSELTKRRSSCVARSGRCMFCTLPLPNAFPSTASCVDKLRLSSVRA